MAEQDKATKPSGAAAGTSESGQEDAAAKSQPKSSGARKGTAAKGDAYGGKSPEDRDRAQRLGTGTGGTTDEMAAELDSLGVDARLDNRVGRHRPTVSPHLKPQQYPGPEVGHFAEHDAANREEFLAVTGQSEEVAGSPLGMRATGQLGRGEHADRDESAPVHPEPK